jgi:hypothetical protein
MISIERLMGRPPDEIIGKFRANGADEDRAFMNRWHILRRAKAKRFRFNIYLHQFVRSDEDRALHDHPWWSVSFLLRGKATEHIQYDGVVRYTRKIPWLWPVFRKATHTHRIEIHTPDVVTIFITGRKVREWGFHCPQGWRHWTEFAFGQGCD